MGQDGEGLDQVCWHNERRGIQALAFVYRWDREEGVCIESR